MKLCIFIICFFSIECFSQTYGGINQSLDFNIYRFYGSGPIENDVKNRCSIGFTTGFLLEQKFNNILGINLSFAYSEKKYFPDRVFSFGELKNVEISVLELPVNIRVSLDKWLHKDNFEYYFLIGGVYQVEVKKSKRYENLTVVFPPEKKEKFIIPSFSIGTQRQLNEKFFISGEINVRGGKCHCEFLNRKIDKISVVISIKRKFF